MSSIRPQRIVIFGLPLSSNLGDTLIAKTMREELRREFPEAEIESVDITGRQAALSSGRLTLRKMILRSLNYFPSWLASASVLCIAGIWIRWLRHPSYLRAVQECDFAVIGGGQLFRDNNLFIPILLNRLCRELGREKTPYAIFGCGITKGWSRAGGDLFREVFEKEQNVLTVLRDPVSFRYLKEIISPDRRKYLSLAPDPVFLLETIDRSDKERESRKPVVGVGVISPILLEYYADKLKQGDLDDLESRWIQYLENLLEEGFAVRLFSTGNPEDQEFAAQLYRACEDRFDNNLLARCHLVPVCEDSEALVRCISELDLLIAYRMHAQIIAISQNVPVVMVEWDSKLDGLAEMLGKEVFGLNLNQMPQSALVSLARKAIDSGGMPSRSRRMRDHARSGLDQLVAVIKVKSG